MSTPSPGPTTTPSPSPSPTTGPSPGSTPTPGATHLPSPTQPPGPPSPQPTPSPSPNASPTPPSGAPSGPPAQLPPPSAPTVTSPWTGPGTIDVQPLHLYQVSAALAVEQQSFHRALVQFLDFHASYARVGGNGTVTAQFATQYAAVASLLIEVHGKAVVAIGGAAVGFTTTANNYRQADAATHPNNPPFTPQASPQVLFAPPAYTAPPPFGVRDGNAVDEFADIFDDGDIPGSLMRTVIEEALRTGRALEILPLPHYLRVNELSQAWLPYQTGLGIVQGQLTATVDSITNHANGDWHGAMLQFVSSLWGSTAWGKNTVGYEWRHDPPTGAGTSLPVFAVLSTTGQMLAQALRSYAEAAEKVRTELRGILYRAFKAAVVILDLGDIKGTIKDFFDRLRKLSKGLLAAVLLNIDTAAINKAVDTYEAALRTQINVVEKLLEPLREASRAVPTFQSQSARAEAFGARSLFEFNRSIVPLNEQSRDPNNRFGIDLASMEWETNPFQPPPPFTMRPGHDAHTIDKHVGLTPEQLNVRVRDQGVDSSAFPNLPVAQKSVQAALNDPDNIRTIEDWMEKQKQRVANGTFRTASAPELKIITVQDANGANVVTGTSVLRSDFDAHGFGVQPTQVHSVKLLLAYSPDSGTFYVRTAYPSPP
ncbi:RNase A-like domain-containing protein [Streptomyces sp. NPDC002057]|uniref:RNase A-like domain-containing protein n=1 Tax=Streptomyces sp. NPDC002057 TaxID=3154664 RepID=UPI00331A4AF6